MGAPLGAAQAVMGEKDLALLPRLAFSQRQAWAVGLSPNPPWRGLKLTQLESSAEPERADTGTK